MGALDTKCSTSCHLQWLCSKYLPVHENIMSFAVKYPSFPPPCCVLPMSVNSNFVKIYVTKYLVTVNGLMFKFMFSFFHLPTVFGKDFFPCYILKRENGGQPSQF